MTPGDLFDLERVLAVAITLLTDDERRRLCNVLGMASRRLDQLCDLALDRVTYGPGQPAHPSPNAGWRIRCRRDVLGEPQYWSHELGWTELRSADLFSDDERATLLLPHEGVWEQSEIPS